jgi:hypothetical protein
LISIDLWADIAVDFTLNILENQVHTDVIFNVKSTAISAHRSILINRSQVFENLLTGRSSLDIIDVPDIEPDVFRNMLRYIFVTLPRSPIFSCTSHSGNLELRFF